MYSSTIYVAKTPAFWHCTDLRDVHTPKASFREDTIYVYKNNNNMAENEDQRQEGTRDEITKVSF